MLSALIPPVGLESTIHRARTHMAIAPVCMTSGEFIREYLLAHRVGDFTIIDNGAFEKRKVTPAELVHMAIKIEAEEIVVPDVLQDSSGTTEACQLFLDEYPNLDFRYMGVVQGRTYQQYYKCVDWYAKKPKVVTLGIPRHTIESMKSSFRIDLSNWIAKNYPGRFTIHLLGTNPVWLGEVKAATKYAPHIRSVDTSLPYYYAIANTSLETPTGIPTRVARARPPDYFTKNYRTRINTKLLDSNIEAFLRWTVAEASVS